MEQQTAVDWLMTELVNKGLLVTDDYKNLVAYSKAKQMEKEQIIDAFNEGENNSVDYFNPENRIKESEEYYNETYGK